MPANIEIKARARNFPEQIRRAAELADGPERRLEQRDTFFVTGRGRLKLRLFADGEGELIHYERDDVAGPKRSQYLVLPLPDPQTWKTALASACGVLGVVEKTRRLFLVGQTRIHCDEVRGLGAFIELEVVMREEQDEVEGVAIAADLMRRLGIEESDLVTGAYLDLLTAGSR